MFKSAISLFILSSMILLSCRREDKKYNLIRNLKDSRFEVVSYEAKFYYPDDSIRSLTGITDGEFSVDNSNLGKFSFRFVDSANYQGSLGTFLADIAGSTYSDFTQLFENQYTLDFQTTDLRDRHDYFIFATNKFELIKPFSDVDILMHAQVKTTKSINESGTYPHNLDSVVETFVFKKLN